MEFIGNVISIIFSIGGHFLGWFIFVGIVYAILFGIKFLLWKNNPPLIIHKTRWIIAIAIGVIMLWAQFSSGVSDPSDRTSFMIVAFVIYTIGTLVLKDEEES